MPSLTHPQCALNVDHLKLIKLRLRRPAPADDVLKRRKVCMSKKVMKCVALPGSRRARARSTGKHATQCASAKTDEVCLPRKAAAELARNALNCVTQCASAHD